MSEARKTVSTRTTLALALASALCLFGLSYAIAQRTVPALTVSSIPPKAAFIRSLQSIADQLGYSLVSQAPELHLLEKTRDLKALGRLEGVGQRDWIIRSHRQLVIEVSQRAYRKKRYEGCFITQLSLDGRPWLVQWGDLRTFFRSGPVPEGDARELLPLATVLLTDGEALRPRKTGFELGTHFGFYLIGSATPAQYVYAQVAGTIARSVRNVGTAAALDDEQARLRQFFGQRAIEILILLVAIGLCVRLALQGRTRWRTGLFLATAGMIISVLSITDDPGQDVYFVAFGVAVLSNLLVLTVWVAGESFSSALPGNPAAALDEIVSRREGAMAGPEIIWGLAMGLGLAALRWLTLAFAYWRGSIWLKGGSVLLQNTQHNENFFSYGVLLAGLVLLADAAVAVVRVPYFWSAGAAGTILLTLFSKWGPWYAAACWELPVVLALLWMARRRGVLGTLTASVVATTSLPFAFALAHPSWSITSLVVGATVCGATAAGVGWSYWRRTWSVPRRTGEYWRCFISYSHKDWRFANALERALTASGVECWLDDRSVLLGDKILNRIYKAIFVDSEVAIICCSRYSLQSTWVERELDMVLKKEDERRRTIRDAIDRPDLPPISIALDLDHSLAQWKSGYAVLLETTRLGSFDGWDRNRDIFEGGVSAILNAIRVKRLDPPPGGSAVADGRRVDDLEFPPQSIDSEEATSAADGEAQTASFLSRADVVEAVEMVVEDIGAGTSDTGQTSEAGPVKSVERRGDEVSEADPIVTGGETDEHGTT